MDAFAALGEPRRREILRLVSSKELSVGEIARRFDISRPAISQHLRVLKGAGLVSERRNGTRHVYRVEPKGLAELREWFEGFWDEVLAGFKAAAESEGSTR